MERFMSRLHQYGVAFRSVKMAARAMLRGFFFAVALLALTAVESSGQNFTVWTGEVSDEWTEDGNWDTGIPNVVGRRARIQKPVDSGFWPVIKNLEEITFNSRLGLPFGPYDVVTPITYAHLTIESGGKLTVNNDFRAGENDPDEAPDPLNQQKYIGSLTVAGSLTIGGRARFGDSDFTTMDVDVTGTIIHLNTQEAFRIGGGQQSTSNFSMSGNASVSSVGPFEVDDGGLLTFADNASLKLSEYIFEDEDEEENPIFIPVTKAEIIASVQEFVTAGLMQGLTNTYTGTETLLPLGNGLSYFEDATSITIVAAATEAIPGDLNLDGVVDARDYVFWRENALPESEYNAWKANFGAPGSSASGGSQEGLASVPECSTVAMVAGVVASLTWLRRRGTATSSQLEQSR